MMSTAFSDVAEKSVIMRQNKSFMLEKFGLNLPSLNAIIDEELQRNIARLNGDNNKKELAKLNGDFAKDAWERKYNSTARNLVRMWWLTKFLTKLLDNLINLTDMTLVSACKDAY